MRLSFLTEAGHAVANDPLVLILGSGRAGTTTYMNLLRDGLNAACLWEPLRPASSPRATRVVPAHGYPRLRAGERDDELAAYLDDLVARRALTRWSASRTSLTELRTRPALVVKEVRANRMAGWLQQRYPEAHLRVLLRHPLMVVDSMMRAPHGWSEMSWDLLVPPAADALGCRAAELATRADPRELHLFAVWLADTARVLGDLRAGERTVVDFYESLRSESAETVRRAAAGLSGFDEAAALRAIARPSDTASDQLDLSRPERLPDTDPAVVLRVQDLLDRFGVACYVATTTRPVPEALPKELHTP